MIYSFIYSCNTAGLGFNLKGVLYSNNSIVNITDIGNGTNALYCFTNGSDCCRESDRGTNGKWFFPDGRQVDENGRVSTLDFNRNRGPSAVLLNRRNNAMGPTGFYRCEVLDARNVVQSIYVGLYKGQYKSSLYKYIQYCSHVCINILSWLAIKQIYIYYEDNS